MPAVPQYQAPNAPISRIPAVGSYVLHCTGGLVFAIAVEVFNFAQLAICFTFIFVGVVVDVGRILRDVFWMRVNASAYEDIQPLGTHL